MGLAETIRVEEKLTDFISEVFLTGNRNTSITPQTSLLETRVVDSLGILEIIEFMEQEFGITVEESDMIPENLDSIDKMTRFIKVKAEG
jgi:acyl carrier protein